MSSNITVQEIESIQKAWANAVTNKNIQELMDLYASNAVLKPTISNSIRRTHEDIRSYFVGDKKIADAGFLQQGIVDVQFVETSPILLDNVAIDTGIYEFTKANGAQIIAHFTFCYQKFADGRTLILSQHSSKAIDAE